MAAEDHAGIRVMTVHAAKGLEFDCVAVADLGRKLAGGGQPPSLRLAFDPEGGTEEASAPRIGLRLARAGAGALDVAGYRQLNDEAADADAEESGRLAYVAASRARSRLLLSGTVRPREGHRPLREAAARADRARLPAARPRRRRRGRADPHRARPRRAGGHRFGLVRAGANPRPRHRPGARAGRPARRRRSRPAALRRRRRGQSSDAGAGRTRDGRRAHPLLRGAGRLPALRLPVPRRAGPADRAGGRGDGGEPGRTVAAAAGRNGLRSCRARAARVVGAELVAIAPGGDRGGDAAPRGLRARGRRERGGARRRLARLGSARRAPRRRKRRSGRRFRSGSSSAPAP